MDLLFHRYASPFLLLDQVITYDNLSDFVTTIWNANDEEMQWQYFLAKIFDKSFAEFKESLVPQQPVSKQELETTIKESMDMMNTFIPE